MPSKLSISLLKQDNQITILKESINTLTENFKILESDYSNLQSKNQTNTLKERPYGLEDLALGKTPTFFGWTVDPTDAEKITDGNPATSSTTGEADVAGWVSFGFQWDLGSMYDVIVTAVANPIIPVGQTYIFYDFWTGSAWEQCKVVAGNLTQNVYATAGCRCSKVQLSYLAGGAGLNTHETKEFHIYRVN